MTLTVCEIHGSTIMTLVSSDILEDFRNNSRPSEQYHEIRVATYDEDSYESWCWCSSKIVKEFTIPVDKVISLDELEKFVKLLHLEPICMMCLLDWLDQ
jgi:hypothetical protein